MTALRSIFPAGLRLRLVIVPMLAAPALAGCAVAAGVALTEGAQKVWEDRSASDQLTDAGIATRFAKHLVDIDTELYLDVSVDVWEGRAMLTGALSDAELRERVAAILRGDSDVKALYDEIRIVPKAEVDKRRADREKGESAEGGGTFSDLWIEGKIKAQLVTTADLKSVNFRWRAVQGHVYVIGTATSAAQQDKVLKTLRETGGVKSVKSFIVIKASPPRAV